MIYRECKYRLPSPVATKRPFMVPATDTSASEEPLA